MDFAQVSLAQSFRRLCLERPLVAALLVFFGIHALGMLVEPIYVYFGRIDRPVSAFGRYFITQEGHSDAAVYMRIATEGYKVAGETALFPLWPAILRALSQIFDEHFGLASQLLAVGFFSVGLGFFARAIQPLLSARVAAWTLLLICLNPQSIFYVQAYTESLFFLLSGIWLYTLVRMARGDAFRFNVWILFATAVVMGCTRPVVYQQGFAVGLTAMALVGRYGVGRSRPFIRCLLVSLGGTVVGYLLVCTFTWIQYGDFFASYKGQAGWGRTLGFYHQLILAPATLNGSREILTWDLLAFYLPFFLVAVWLRKPASHLESRAFQPLSAPSPVHGKPLDLTVLKDGLALYAALFATAHGLINLVTYPRFYSLARHVGANPMIYLAGALILTRLELRPAVRKATLRTFAVISGLFVWHWWTRFARNGWMG
jgi:hypothetical protein